MRHSRLFDELIIKSWWTILFFLFCFFAYDQASARRLREERRLQAKLETLLTSKEEALVTQEDLKLQIASQNDRAWIEMTLMRRLGLVPEGATKILFVPEK